MATLTGMPFDRSGSDEMGAMSTMSMGVRRAGTATLIGAISLAFLTGCGSASDAGDAATDTPTSAATKSTTPPTTQAPVGSPGGSALDVPAVLKFTARTVDGSAFSGSSLAGKPTVLWFWAPWCAVCKSQAPQVKSLVATYGDNLNVIGVGSLDSSSAISGFANEVQGPTHLSDPGGDLWKRFRIFEQSSFVVLDASGKEVLRTGYNDDDKLSGVVRRLVG